MAIMTTADGGAGGMGDLAKKTKDKVDALLKDREASLLRDTTVDLETLRPKISDGASFDKLIDAVNTSTQQNENIAQLKQRIVSLGSGVLQVAKTVAGLLGSI
jgi:hypothetical protein